MIRNRRTWITVNVVGTVAALFVLISWLVRPPNPGLLPPWFWQADAAFIFVVFLYNIVRGLRGPIEPAPWTRRMTDRQWWIVKGLLIVVVIGGVFAFTILYVPRH